MTLTIEAGTGTSTFNVAEQGIEFANFTNSGTDLEGLILDGAFTILVPEPGSLVLLMAGMGLALARNRR